MGELQLNRFGEITAPRRRRLIALPNRRPTLAVGILIAINLAMFGAETLLGGSTNPATLHSLGWLELGTLSYTHQYWRLFTALFLHYGVLHIFFNLYALFVIGPGLERAIGAIRFSLAYLISGLGSSLGMVLLHAIHLTTADALVGASGCIMGLVGVWAGMLLRHRYLPSARRRLFNILIIVVIQTAFDLATPQVSMGAHWSGLLTGFVLGLIFATRDSAA